MSSPESNPLLPINPNHKHLLPRALALVVTLALTACTGTDNPTATTATTTTTAPISSILAGIELGQRHVTLNGVDLAPLFIESACDLVDDDSETVMTALVEANGVEPVDEEEQDTPNTVSMYFSGLVRADDVYAFRWVNSSVMQGFMVIVDPTQQEHYERVLKEDLTSELETGKLLPIVYPSRFEREELEQLTDYANQVIAAATRDSFRVNYFFHTDSLYAEISGSDADAGRVDDVERALERAGLDEVISDICIIRAETPETLDSAAPLKN